MSVGLSFGCAIATYFPENTSVTRKCFRCAALMPEDGSSISEKILANGNPGAGWIPYVVLLISIGGDVSLLSKASLVHPLNN